MKGLSGCKLIKIIFPVYDAEEWIGISNVQNLDYIFVVVFWKMYNKYLLNLIKGIKPITMNNVWKNEDGKEYTLRFLIEDYFAHMKLHIQMFIDKQQKIEKSEMT
jgi:hypothetical protein